MDKLDSDLPIPPLVEPIAHSRSEFVFIAADAHTQKQ